jgi:hypothetical protein
MVCTLPLALAVLDLKVSHENMFILIKSNVLLCVFTMLINFFYNKLMTDHFCIVYLLKNIFPNDYQNPLMQIFWIKYSIQV